MVGTVEEAVATMGGKKSVLDGLSEFDRSIIGNATRIEIPFTDVYSMRRIAELLRGYAEMMDVYSRRHDIKDRSILLDLKIEAKRLNRRIRILTGYRKNTNDKAIEAAD